MSNLRKEVRGVDRIAGNLLMAIPDCKEYQDRLHTICEALRAEIRELVEVDRQQSQRLKSINVNLGLLADEIRRADDVIRSWEVDIEEGAHDLGLLMPILGFRVIKDIPKEIA